MIKEVFINESNIESAILVFEQEDNEIESAILTNMQRRLFIRETIGKLREQLKNNQKQAESNIQDNLDFDNSDTIIETQNVEQYNDNVDPIITVEDLIQHEKR